MPVLYDAPGRHCQVTVTEENGLRRLWLDGCEEGAMDLASETPVFHYLHFHRASALVGRPVRRALVLGAGAFTAAKCLALDHAAAAIDAVDVEPSLEEVGRRFFRLDGPAFARVRFHGLAAEDFLKAPGEPYDFVFDDLFDGFQHVPDAGRGPGHFARLRAVLAPDGVCLKNLIWDPYSVGSRAACAEAVAAWQATFPVHLTIALGPPGTGHNLLLLGASSQRLVDVPALERLVSPLVTWRLADEHHPVGAPG